MLPLHHRLRKKKEIQRIFKKGRSWGEESLQLKVMKEAEAKPFMVGVIVPVRIAKKAAARNRVRRRLGEAVRRNLPLLKHKGWQGVVMARDDLSHLSFHDLSEQLIRLFKKSSLLSL